jgi:hypothetical protein
MPLSLADRLIHLACDSGISPKGGGLPGLSVLKHVVNSINLFGIVAVALLSGSGDGEKGSERAAQGRASSPSSSEPAPQPVPESGSVPGPPRTGARAFERADVPDRWALRDCPPASGPGGRGAGSAGHLSGHGGPVGGVRLTA